MFLENLLNLASHDVEGMIDIYGGHDAFGKKLNHFFEDGWYNHGNEPDHHAAYLYAFLPNGSPHLQRIVRKILNSQYGPRAQDLSVRIICFSSLNTEI